MVTSPPATDLEARPNQARANRPSAPSEHGILAESAPTEFTDTTTSQLSTRGLAAQVLGDRLANNTKSRYPSVYSAHAGCDQLLIDDIQATDSRPNRVGRLFGHDEDASA